MTTAAVSFTRGQRRAVRLGQPKRDLLLPTTTFHLDFDPKEEDLVEWWRTKSRRLGVTLGLGLTLMGAAGLVQTPAAHAVELPKLDIRIADALVAAGSPGLGHLYAARADVRASHEFSDLTLTFDNTGLNGFATASLDSDSSCSQEGAIITCQMEYNDLDENWRRYPGLIIVPTKGASPGQEGTFTATISSAEAVSASTTVKVSLGEGVNLTDTTEGTKELFVAPGGHFTAQTPSVRNAGQTTVHGLEIHYFGHGFGFPRHYSNCLYRPSWFSCHFDIDLKPGDRVRVDHGMQFTVSPDAEAPRGSGVEWNWSTAADAAVEPGSEGVPGTGGVLKLVRDVRTAVASPKQTDTDGSDNSGFLGVNVTVNFAAVGAELKSTAGSLVTARVGVTNKGPVTADYSRSGTPLLAASIEIPVGTTAVTAPKACKGNAATTAGSRNFLCHSSAVMKVGDTDWWELGLRIDSAMPTKGLVMVNRPRWEQDVAGDIDASDDTAAILVNQPTSSPAPGMPQPSAPAPPTASPQGQLPVTGKSIAGVGIAGTGLLLVGAATVVVARRRRVQTSDIH